MAREIVPGVFQISGPGIGAFLLAAEELVLIDTHLPKRLPKLLAAVRKAGRRSEDVRHIVITHYHLDHVGGLAAAAEATGGDVYVHPGDAAVIRNGVEAPIRPIGIGRVVLPAFYAVRSKRFRPAPIDHDLADGDEIGSTGLRAIHTPGHTSGHMSFLWPERGGVLFVGDALANNMGRLSFGYSCEDMDAAKQSLRKLTQLEFEVAVFGHGLTIKRDAAAKFRQKLERLGEQRSP
jgi:glyoxylase-like metal-dependent hydrolase (beta-lactamase superfamily II)